jgi:hypothetical protein
MSTCIYLHVGREEGELQRPPVLHAAGDHAGEDEPAEADRHRGVSRGGAPAAPGAADADRELQLAVAASHAGARSARPEITATRPAGPGREIESDDEPKRGMELN